jgi:hypothetical protein
LFDCSTATPLHRSTGFQPQHRRTAALLDCNTAAPVFNFSTMFICLTLTSTLTLAVIRLTAALLFVAAPQHEFVLALKLLCLKKRGSEMTKLI